MTNGVTPRRWIALSNPKLSALITRHIGDRWTANLEDELQRIEPLAGDVGFQREWQAVKADNKRVLADLIKERTSIVARSALVIRYPGEACRTSASASTSNVCTTWSLSANRLRARPGDAAATSPNGHLRRQGRSRIPHGQADRSSDTNPSRRSTINRRPARLPGSQGGVPAGLQRQERPPRRLARRRSCPEQISRQAKRRQAGNMKFAMNRAITIGTLDGANVTPRRDKAREFFLFGLTAEEVEQSKAGITRRASIKSELRGGRPHQFPLPLNGDRGLSRRRGPPLTRDDYMPLADYQAYMECQQRQPYSI